MKKVISCNNKGIIIYNSLLFNFTNDEAYKEKALEELKFFAVYYHVQLKKIPFFKMKLLLSIDEFVSNKIGYKLTVINLFNALK